MGCHTATALVVSDGIDLIRLPPTSPGLQPAEHLWPLLDEPMANRAFADLEARRWRTLSADRATILSATPYAW